MPYSEALTIGIDFVGGLYVPAGLTSTQYATDAPNYVNDTVMALTPVNAGGIAIYVPSSILATVPDPMVGCYNNVAIGVTLGEYADASKIAWVVSEIQSIVGSVLGITAPTVKLYSLNTTYMTNADYAALQAARIDAESPYPTLYQQLQNQIALTTAAQNLNTYYANTLRALAGVPVPAPTSGGS